MSSARDGQHIFGSDPIFELDPRFLAHYEETPALLHSIDREGRIIAVSHRWLEAFGYTRDQVIGRKSSEFLTEKSKRFADQVALPEFFRTGHCRDIPYEWVRGDGEVVNVLLSATSIRDESGRFLCSRAVLVDVTQFERSQARLLKTQQELELAQAINKTGSWSFDLVRDRIWWSPELFRIFRRPEADVAPSYSIHHTLFEPQSWEILEAAVARAVEEGVPYELELELAETEDSPRFGLARGQAQRDEDGRIVRLVGTLQEVTDLVRTRQERDRAAERIALAKSAAGIGIWEWNVTTDRLVWDSRMYELYGIPEDEEISYETWSQRIYPQDLALAERDLATVVDGAGDFYNTFRVCHSELGARYIRAAATLIRGPGAEQRMIGVNWDVSQQVALEEEAHRSRNLESLGLLAGGIAHDFNNLLTAILARAEFLDMELDGHDEAREMIQGIVTAVESAEHLTSQLLTFSKGGEPQKEPVSLEKLVRDRVSFSIRGSRTEVVYFFPSDLLAVEMDPGQLGQVIQNLALNADQAMPTGGRLEIVAENVLRSETTLPPVLNGEHYVRLEIRDSGVGISESDLGQIYDPYFSTKATGHGLGLAICHSIIERHHGCIQVASTLGEGTVFTIFLPAVLVESTRVEPAGRLVTGEGSILIVDDQEDIRVITKKQLGALGYEVEDAASVEEALIAYRQRLGAGRPYDLVLTDLTIPGSGGGQLLVRQLRDLHPDANVVVSSGYGADPVMANYRAYGFAARLEKPVRFEELGRVIAEVLGARS